MANPISPVRLYELLQRLREEPLKLYLVFFEAYGESVDAATLIPHMLESFMAGDRGFKKDH